MEHIHQRIRHNRRMGNDKTASGIGIIHGKKRIKNCLRSNRKCYVQKELGHLRTFYQMRHKPGRLRMKGDMRDYYKFIQSDVIKSRFNFYLTSLYAVFYSRRNFNEHPAT